MNGIWMMNINSRGFKKDYKVMFMKFHAHLYSNPGPYLFESNLFVRCLIKSTVKVVDLL